MAMADDWTNLERRGSQKMQMLADLLIVAFAQGPVPVVFGGFRTFASEVQTLCPSRTHLYLCLTRREHFFFPETLSLTRKGEARGYFLVAECEVLCRMIERQMSEVWLESNLLEWSLLTYSVRTTAAAKCRSPALPMERKRPSFALVSVAN